VQLCALTGMAERDIKQASKQASKQYQLKVQPDALFS
jgi:hypothetical protein